MALFDKQDIERRAAQFKRELEAMPNNWFLKTFLPPQETTTMTTPDQQLEAAIVAAGANVAPRITPADIEANIASEHFFSAIDGRNGAILAETYEGRERPELDDTDLNPLKLLTFCVLILRNGFTVTGESACASPENFNAEIGRRIARENAVQKIWPLMGYALKNTLAGTP